MESMTPKQPAPHARRLTLALGALGVVFGDIGTSPLYTLSECLGHLGKGPFQPADVLGLLSLVVWSLTGMSIVLTSHADGIPPVLSQLVRQVKALSETVLLVTVRVLHQPHVADVSQLTDLGHGFCRLVMTCGYMDEPNVPRAVALAIERDSLRFDLEHATYFVARDTFIATSAGRMGRISEGFFALLARNTSSLSGYFFLPPHQVVEIGEQRDL